MPDEPTTTYCTADDVRLYSGHPAFTAVDDEAEGEPPYIITDEQLEARIIAAEIVIDAEAKYVQKLVTTQTRKFPRVEDTTGAIPEAIKMATIYQVEFMYVNAPDVDHGVEPDVSPTAVTVSPRAKKLMSAGFIKTTGSVTIPPAVNPQTVQGAASAYNGDIHFQQED